jgi:DNA polymerase III delta prime subunit
MSDPKDLPRWMKELNRYLPIKTQFYISGNIYDQILYPIKQNEGFLWCYLNLRDFFNLFFLERGYKLIGFYDLVDGIVFKNELMYESFTRLIQEKGFDCEKSQLQELPGKGKAKLQACLVDVGKALDYIRITVSNETVPTAFIIDYSSRLTSSPDKLYDEERLHFLKILKCAQDSARVKIGNETFNNVTVLLCDRLNDIPPWLYLNNPLTKPLQIDKPDEGERRKFITSALSRDDFPKFFDSEGLKEEEKKKIVERFVDLTDGLGNYELESLRKLSEREQIRIKKSNDIKNVVERYKFGIVESAWDKVNVDKLKNAEYDLKQRVKGQEEAIHSVLDIIKRSKMGLSGIQHSSKASKPRGILFFAGPTGVGKTEMAKALADVLFGDEKKCIRFDMSEYSLEHADQKLLGAPPGYVGYEEGGQLTNKIKEHPFSVLLFDEIEKAHPKILDKFLQILEDGRMTDGRGETVYFSESIIIFTSNKGAYVNVPIRDRDGRIAGYERRVNIRPTSWFCGKCNWIDMSEIKPEKCEACGSDIINTAETPYREIKERIMSAIKKYFNEELGRPELLNRFGENFVVFDYIRPPIMMEIIEKILKNIINEVKEKHKIDLAFSDNVREWLQERTKNNIEHGGRGVGNLIEKAIINPLARKLFDENVAEGRSLVVEQIESELKGTVERYSLKIV